jgi:hypothetical protein
VWYEKFDGNLRKLGLCQSEHMHAIYYRGGRGGDLLIIGVYVDDLIIMGTTPCEIVRFKEMKLQFKMANLGLLIFYLGLEVQQGGGIKLCQEHYVMRILEAAGMADCNSTHAPMEERLKLNRDIKAEEEDATLYRKLSGSLRNHTPCVAAEVAATYSASHEARPDLCCGLSQSLHAASHAKYMAALKRVLRYIARMIDYGCFYRRGTSGAKVVGYIGNDYAGDVDDTTLQVCYSSSAQAW